MNVDRLFRFALMGLLGAWTFSMWTLPLFVYDEELFQTLLLFKGTWQEGIFAVLLRAYFLYGAYVMVNGLYVFKMNLTEERRKDVFLAFKIVGKILVMLPFFPLLKKK